MNGNNMNDYKTSLNELLNDHNDPLHQRLHGPTAKENNRCRVCIVVPALLKEIEHLKNECNTRPDS